MTALTTNEIYCSLYPFRRDGIFIKDIKYLDALNLTFNLTLANYITDMDNGHAIECLYEKEVQEDGAECAQCYNITAGRDNTGALTDPNCVPCPFCNVPTKRYALKERLYVVTLGVSVEEGVKVLTERTMPKVMIYNIVLSLTDTVDVLKKVPPQPLPLNLSGGCPSYGFTPR